MYRKRPKVNNIYNKLLYSSICQPTISQLTPTIVKIYLFLKSATVQLLNFEPKSYFDNCFNYTFHNLYFRLYCTCKLFTLRLKTIIIRFYVFIINIVHRHRLFRTNALIFFFAQRSVNYSLNFILGDIC